MTRMKKLLTLVLSALLLLSLAAAPVGQAEQLEELTLTIMNPIFSASPLGTPVMDEFLARLETYANKELGSTLNITWVEPGFWDHLGTQSVYLAAGDFPDVFMVYQIANTLSLGENELIVDLNQYMDKLPNLSALLKEDPAGQKAITASATGGIYGFPDATISTTNSSFCNYYLRFDTLKANNITPPESMDELFEVAKQLKELNPASYPFSSWGSDIFRPVLRWNHTEDSVYYNGEKYVFGPTDDEDRVKASIQWLADMYAAGLIDPEYGIRTDDQTRTKMLDGTFYFMPDSYLDQINQHINNNENFTDVEWGTMHQITNQFGEISWQPAASKMGTAIGPDFASVINIDTKEPEKVARLLDYAKLDPEMIKLVNWGVEGLTYNVESDGSYKYVEEVTSSPSPTEVLAKYGLSVGCRSGFMLMPQITGAVSARNGLAPIYEDGKYGVDTIYEFGDRVNGDKAIMPSQTKDAPMVNFSEDEKDDISSIKTPIDTYVNESFAKFMVGEWTVDGQWAQFIDTLNGMGDIQSVVDMYNAKLQ